MADAVYATLHQLALQLLTQYGRPAAVTRKGAPSYDATTGAVTNPSSSSLTGAAAVFPLPAGRAWSESRFPELTLTDKHEWLVLALDALEDAAPRVGDVVTLGSSAYQVDGVTTTAPAGARVLHECIVRGVPGA